MRLIPFLLTLLSLAGAALAEILPPEQAFRLSAEHTSERSVNLHWDMEEGYYLYKDKFKFFSKNDAIKPGLPEFPKGEIKSDNNFGDVEVYRGKLDLVLPIEVGPNAPETSDFTVGYQGCADIGVCYPPIKTELKLPRPQTSNVDLSMDQPASKNAFADFGFDRVQSELLPADQAFRFFATVKDADTLHVDWEIAEGYYLYREKFGMELNANESVELGRYEMPKGSPKFDEEFGNVEVFHERVEFDLPLIRKQAAAVTINLVARFQGCAEIGVCYPPMKQSIALDLPAALNRASLSGDASAVALAAATADQSLSGSASFVSEQDQIALALKHDSLALTMLAFFGYGLLLAFTPCVFPMVPILSGIIVGHGHTISTARAFGLSLCYVLASAITYTIFGILAGLFGSGLNLQALLQTPAVIVAFSALFVLLALSMFGFYNLQIPASLQARLAAHGNRRKGGSMLAVTSMGVVSSLIVGPCVAAPLAGALIYIGHTGDAVLGALALFSMGMGMGFPLLVIGTSAGKLLPKAGTWMNAVKGVFGVMMLGVALWTLQRILPESVTMLLWAALLIIPAIYLRAIDQLPESASGWARLWKGFGIILLTGGILLLIGVASGSKDPFRPLNKLVRSEGRIEQRDLLFTRVNSSSELDRHLSQAAGFGQWVMLDYYADWCVSCQEMESSTFSDPRVKKVLSRLLLVQADVTRDTQEDRELLDRFELFGPPAILFFQPGSKESRAYRIIGYKDADRFLEHLNKLLSNA